MICVSVVDVYEDELMEGECSFGKEWEEIRRESRREEDKRLNDVCKCSRCV
jgi:hypothetical protein